jgi:oxygen-independent coproporphyrinogen-3 oxidase
VADFSNKTLPGLYIHIPFCAKKCPYCDFYSTDELQHKSDFICSIEKEALHYKSRLNHFGSLYLGGGTPAFLADHELGKLIEFIHKHFTFSEDAEITIEANPNDITPDKLNRLSSLGFNRISIGVQSFDDEVLSSLQRGHTAEVAEKAINLTREAGFSNLAIDLMYAVPGQSGKAWKHTLDKTVSFKPEHISCYQLTIKEGTPFWHMMQQGKRMDPDEKTGESFFLATSEFLQESGYLHYEISNFAIDEKHCSAHNRKYWQHVPYLGLGPSAHSFFNNKRWWNCGSVKQYNSLLNKGCTPVDEMEEITDDQLRLEALFLGFRTRKGVELDVFNKYKGVENILPELIQSELVVIKNRRVVPTTKGLLVADSIPLLFG